jgi:hypothetical protein
MHANYRHREEVDGRSDHPLRNAWLPLDEDSTILFRKTDHQPATLYANEERPDEVKEPTERGFGRGSHGAGRSYAQ